MDKSFIIGVALLSCTILNLNALTKAKDAIPEQGETVR
jgi:hypothetical protein